MTKYRVVYAVSYDVEAENESEAEDKAIELLEQEFGDDADVILDCFGSNMTEIEA